MTDLHELIRLKYAIQAIRQRTLTDLEAVEALIDKQLPADDPAPIRVPQGRRAAKKYWRDNGIRAAASHGRKIPRVVK